MASMAGRSTGHVHGVVSVDDARKPQILRAGVGAQVAYVDVGTRPGAPAEP